MGVTFSTKVVFARLVCALPSLAQITCIEVSFRSGESNLSAFPPTCPPVKTVHLDGPSFGVGDVIAKKLGLAVKHLSVGWFNYPKVSPGDEAISTMLQHNGPTLRRLDIRLRQQPPGAPVKLESSERQINPGGLLAPHLLDEAYLYSRQYACLLAAGAEPLFCN